jgi:hypothetical protein
MVWLNSERFRSAGPAMPYPRFDVVTPAEAVSRHLELLATEVAPAL